MGSGMMNKYVLIMSLLFLLMPITSAHFVCGQVTDSNDGMSAEWFSVRVFYTSNPSSSTSCEVSPADNKFCCDAEAIPPRGTWQVGREVAARIFDRNSGYVSDQVSIITTGEGYDVLPQSILKKVITVHNEVPKVSLSNDPLIFLNISLISPYNTLTLEDTPGSSTTLCTSCLSYEGVHNASMGMNHWRLIASDSADNFSESITFAVIGSTTVQRSFVCAECNGNQVKSNSDVHIILNLSFSSEVEDFLLYEYIPLEWKILNASGATVSQYNPQYNVLMWNVSGKDISVEYGLRSPNVGIRGSSYFFKTFLENALLSSEEVTVYNRFSFFPSKSLDGFTRANGIKRNIGVKKPLVINDGGCTVALYPKEESGEVQAQLLSTNTDDLSGVAFARSILTSIPFEKVESIYLEFDEAVLNKNISSKENLQLHAFNQEWTEYPLESFIKDGAKRYRATIPPSVQFAVTLSEGIGLSLSKKSDQTSLSNDKVNDSSKSIASLNTKGSSFLKRLVLFRGL